MQSNSVLAACVFSLVLCSANVQAQTAISSVRADSVHTVDDLVRIENAKALQVAQAEAAKLGLAAPTSAQAAKAKEPTEVRRLVVLTVDSVSGVGDQLRVDLTYDGQRFDGVMLGAKVGPCVVTSIQGKRVSLSTKGKGNLAHLCPSSEWTGVGRAPEMAINGVEGISNSLGGRNLPGVVPMPSGGLPPVAAPMPLPVR